MTQSFTRTSRGTISPSGGVFRAAPMPPAPFKRHYIDVVFTGRVTEQDVDWVANEIDRLLQNHAIRGNVTSYKIP